MSTQNQTYKEGLDQLQNNLRSMLPQEALQVFSNDADALHARHDSILKLSIGDQAPSFSLTNARNEVITLKKLLESSKVILTFYRGNWCPYCNLQLAHYQQNIDTFEQHNAQLVAVSPQTPDESLSIKEKNELSFHVLSDIGNVVARKYTTVFKNADAPVNAMSELGIDFAAHYADDSGELPVPAIFIIQQDGTISFAASLGGDYRNRVEASTIIEQLKN